MHSRKFIHHSLIPSLLAVLLPAIIVVSITHAQTRRPQPFPDGSLQLPAEDMAEPSRTSGSLSNEARWVVRAFFDDRQLVDDLAAWREPWEVHHDEGYLVLDVSPKEYERLLEAGFRLEIDEQSTADLNQRIAALPGQVTGIPGFPCYRTLEETFSAAEAIVADHPDLATWNDIGDSWEKTEPGGNSGYDIWVLRLTNSAIPGPKPKLFITSSIHAREYSPAELNTRLAEYLVEAHDSNADINWLLDYHEIHLLLQANPDGRKRAEAQVLWRKNTNNNHCSDTSQRGVDLNRNFDFQWGCCGGASGQECNELYRGPAAASEPETKTIQNYMRSQFPDQRDDDLSAASPITATGVYLDIHSYGELVLWPWGFSTTPAPNSAGLQTLGRKLAFFNHYEPQAAHELYPADGTADGFAYGDLGLAAFSFELGTTFFEGCTEFENTILPDNLPALIFAAKVARTPFLTPGGPDVLALSVTAGTPVRLTGTVDGTRFNNQNGTEPVHKIAGAEYYIDVPPWITPPAPSAYPMTAVDGAFNETTEEIEATIDTSHLGTGRHIVFVRGQNKEGTWGAFSAVFVDTVSPTVPRIYLPFVVKHN